MVCQRSDKKGLNCHFGAAHPDWDRTKLHVSLVLTVINMVHVAKTGSMGGPERANQSHRIKSARHSQKACAVSTLVGWVVLARYSTRL